MKRFTNHPEPWGEFIDVKFWPEIKHPERYAGKELFLCYVTDPYQPLEETACRTRAILEQMQGSECNSVTDYQKKMEIRYDENNLCRI